MAALLKSAAAASINRGQPSSFYNKDKTNPVFQSLDQEIKKFMGYMRKRNSPGYKKPEDEPSSRASDTLFELWNKYEPRLPEIYYQEKLLQMGDFLMTVREYSLALWQCYDRYLLHFGNINVEEITDVDSFRETFFPEGFDNENAGLTRQDFYITQFRALMGKSISMYQTVRMVDPKLQNKQSTDRCVHILAFLRLVMQVVLPKESLCWLVYNGTIHIYSVSRHLMSLGHSARVLEFLLWACMCMETSVPLLSVKYLPWRSTLYTAVCQCYFDCKATHNAEAFARRGLAKINELNKLESLSSSSESVESATAFRQATVKMAIMVFKRSVYETRRKPKEWLRPKTRANLVEAKNLPWPRTPTERLLADMLEGSAAQFLCILEALNDTNRRILLTSPPAADREVEILDVYAELFMAGQEILAGGGGVRGASIKPTSPFHLPALAGVMSNKPLIAMATKGEDGATIDGAIKLVKMAFCFEQWEVFDALIDSVLGYLRLIDDENFAWDEKALELLLAFEKLNPSRRHKRTMTSVVEEDKDKDSSKERESTTAANETGMLSQPAQSSRSLNVNDEMILAAECLLSIINGPFTPSGIEVDIVVDAALILWNKTKVVFQKHQTGSSDNPKYLTKMENPSKWVFLLDVVHKALCWCGISSVDPALTAEVVIRLALVLESSANIDESESSGVRDTSFSDTQPTDGSQLLISRTSMLSMSMINMNPRNQLLQARDILELGLQNVAYARTASARQDGSSIADVSWAKDLNEDVFTPELQTRETTKATDLKEEETQASKTREATQVTDSKEEETQASKMDLIPESMRGSAMAVWNTIKDLHLELILMYHRVCLKLTGMAPDPTPKNPQPFKRRTCSKMEYGEDMINLDSYIENYGELLTRCNKNQLSKALLLMQRSLLLSDDVGFSKDQKKLLEDAVACIQKAQTEEKSIYTVNNNVNMDPAPSKVPPAPILLCRTDTMMIFKPAPFKSEDGQQVAWYKLFARSAAGSNVKVRLNDYYLPGTGESVPSLQSELRVSGLRPDERYVFAIAAYNTDGQLIGNGIGDSSKPILASHPLPVLMTWAFLSQIAYQVGCYDIAKQACNVLWDHFIAEPPEPQRVTFTTQSEGALVVQLMKLNQKVVCLTSPVLLRQFLTSIFINVDISVREGQLFCDVICDKGPLLKGQLRRLKECEKMLVAIEMAGWLNEANLALQAVVQCYGLLAPLIFYKIPSVAVIQVLQRCHAVLQEIPTGLRQKRQQNIADSLHHMTACITYHMAKVLRSWGQKSLANNFNETGKKLLAIEPPEDEKKDQRKKEKDQTEGLDKERPSDISIGEGDMEAGLLSKMKKKMRRAPGVNKDDQDSPMNEELKALVAHMFSLSKQNYSYQYEVAFVADAHYEHELTGYEDPVVLHAYIAYLPSKLAYREVVKFRKRPKYLEFFVQVAQKALTEGLHTQIVEWCEDTTSSLTRRNEYYLGIKQQGQASTGDDPKRFAVAMTEYSKEKDGIGPTSKQSKAQASTLKAASQASPSKAASQAATASKASQLPKNRKKLKYKPMASTAKIANDALRQAQEEAEIKAIDTCSKYFPEIFRMSQKRKKLRKWCVDEMPWRCQMTLIQGMSHFSNFLHRLETRDKMLGAYSSNLYKTNFLDQEWFTFETAGTFIVGWEGGPSRNPEIIQRDTKEYKKTLKAKNALDSLDLADSERPRTTATGIEIAAAMATGAPPPPAYTLPPEQEDTPRTYRSEASGEEPPKLKPKPTDNFLLSTKNTLEYLKKSFSYFNKAIILAHRGQHWTLLQNSCRALWNCAHTALLRAVTVNPAGEEGLVTIDELRGLVWTPMYMAADCILDMMVQFQNVLESQAQKAKKKSSKLGDYFDSWTGDIKNEKGGSSLKFEPLLDDMSVLDMRWVKRLLLRVIELLYYEQKWEKLVDIALRFSALTNDRYGEQVLPILVQAQRQLQKRINALKGEAPPQAHFRTLMQKIGGLITAKEYLQAQLLTHIDKSNLPKIPPGAQIDPLGHGVYTSKDGQKVVSVPMDIPLSLQTLRGVLDKSQYTCRALQHSRKLLMLYLAGQQHTTDGFLSRQASKVDFQPNTAKPQSTMPPDITQDEFEYIDDVQTSCMPRSQLSTVLTSYEKTIDMLNAKNQKGLAAQSMHELGNLQYHAGNIRGAYKYWSDSLDLTLNTTDAIHTWRQLLDAKDVSGDLLQRCGLWGCLLGGILASNVAQYILTSDLGLRMECCFLSGYFFKALFRSSLPHPRADRDYALYDVGEGCEVTNLVPGLDLLSEKFRCDGRQIAAALRWVTEELARGNHNLFVLPLLTLYSYFATFVCRDLQRSVDGRILKVRVLTELGLFTEGFIVLQRLLHGERLPHIGDSNFRQVESKMSSLKFNTAKPITEPSNLKLLEMVLDKRLSSSLATLYGPHMTCHLSLAQANVFIKLAETLPVLPHIEDTMITDGSVKPYTMSTMSRGGLGSKGVKLSAGSANSRATTKSGKSSIDAKKDEEEELDSVVQKHANKRFTASKKPLTQEMIKGTLLAIADQMVGTIAEVIQENAEHERQGLRGLPAAELELVVLCKLQQAAIGRQKHHSAMSARIVMSALKLLKSSKLFKKKKEVQAPPRILSASHQERPSSLKSDTASRRKQMFRDVPISRPENNLFSYQNFQSRARLDARLWLNCRQALVKCLLIEVRGLGEVKDPETKVLQELADCRQYCIEGLSEAEACGDLESQAEFLFHGALLNIMEGKNQENTISLIEDAISLLMKVPKLSIPAQQLHVICIILKTDLEAAERDDDTVRFTEKTLAQYLTAHNLTLKQMETLGEEIEHYYPKGERAFYSTPMSPIKNIYVPHMLRLAQVKLRIGHAMARNAAKYIRNGTDKDPVTLWTEVMGVLTTALEISQTSVTREANIEAEILFNLGKVERMLVLHGKVQPRKAADTLLQAIQISFRNDHDLGLMRQAYLEVALVYLYTAGLVVLKPNGSLEILTDGMDDASSIRPSTLDSAKSKAKSQKTLSTHWSKKDRMSSRAKSGKSDDMDDAEKNRRAAWLAIRCATAVAQAQRSRMLLIGDAAVTSKPLSDTAQEDIPDFLSLDLVSVYTLGKKKKKYKNEIEEELAPLIEAQETKKVETYEEQVARTKDTAKDLGWIHILGYQTILQRMCFTATVSASSVKKDKKDKTEETGDLGPGFDLGFISHAQYDTTLNHDVVRSMLLCGPWISRLNRLHNYLASNLLVYSASCCGIYPPSALSLPIPSLPKIELEVISRSYSQNLTNPGDVDPSIPLAMTAETGKPLPPPGSNIIPYKPNDKSVTTPLEPQVALQFYQPSLEENDPQKPDAVGADARVLLLYSLYKKSTVPTVQGLQWISMSQLNDLHDRLAVLAQRAEISLQEKEKQKKEPVTPSPTPTAKTKKTQRIKALSPKVQKDEQLETLLGQCVNDVLLLLGMVSEPETSTTTPEIPFEVSKMNIRSLENLFDPSFGALISTGDMVKWLLKVVHSSDTSKETTRESTVMKESRDASPTKDPSITKESTRESTA